MIIKKKKMIMKIMLCSHFHTAHRINVKFGPASMIILKIGAKIADIQILQIKEISDIDHKIIKFDIFKK